ncbi:MAG TPA: hypothetical protein VIH79_04350 [Candidatus Nanopelagicaceae bacterium]
MQVEFDRDDDSIQSIAHDGGNKPHKSTDVLDNETLWKFSVWRFAVSR